MNRRRCQVDVSADGCEKSRRLSCDGIPSVGQEHLEQEKRVRREIANSNERRRMQSINAGFDSLRILLPPVQDGEKMSKATILQLTAEYIHTLLNRVNMLENEVAVYRKSAGIQPVSLIPDFSIDLELPRKSHPMEQKKRSSCLRTRRRRMDPDLSYPTRSELAGFSPTGVDIHQVSPSNSFNSSISISPPSPLPDGINGTSARLEHLVMAIEQIEGGKALQSPGNESQDDSISINNHSPHLCGESYWQSPPRQCHGFGDPESQSLKVTQPSASLTDVFALSSITDTSSVAIPLNESNSHNRNTTDYPLVTKLLNRPIPHKYLHRPQVVVNSSH